MGSFYVRNKGKTEIRATPERHTDNMASMLSNSRLLPFYTTFLIFFIMTKITTDRPTPTIGTAFFKALPIWSLISYVTPRGSQISQFTKLEKNIAMGLLCSSFGDIALVWFDGLFYLGAVCFTLAHGFYLRAYGFTNHSRMTLVYMFGGISILVMLYPYIPMRDIGLAVGYIGMIFTVSWRAMAKYETDGKETSKAGVFGTFSFIISDFLLVVGMWIMRFQYHEFFIMVTYYLAQLGIAISSKRVSL